MNTRHSFVAERAAAQHCAELLERTVSRVDLLPALARMGEVLGRLLCPAFARLLGSEAIVALAEAPVEIGSADLAEATGPLAANTLFSFGPPDAVVLASIDGESMLRLVDRAFGGRGDAPGPLPAAFPLSAELMIQRTADLLGRALGEALGRDALSPVRSDSNLADLAPFPAGSRLYLMRIELREDQRAPLRLCVALQHGQLGALFGHHETALRRTLARADPAAAPFADVPLPLTATLVEMALPLAALARLEPGTVLPVAVTRAVPLAIAGTVLARGTVGAQDDRIALKLTQLA